MLAVLGLCVLTVIKQWKSDFSPLLRIGMTVLFGGMILASLSPILQKLEALGGTTLESTHFSVLLKALGVAFLTHFAAELCRESGENGVAGNVELAGKLEILLLCLPLIEDVLGLARDLLSVGGGT